MPIDLPCSENGKILYDTGRPAKPTAKTAKEESVSND